MKKKLLFVTAMIIGGISSAMAQSPTITLRLDDANKTVSPTLYGLMTEEINYSYEGGLYAQLLRNPGFNETTEEKRAFHPLPTKPKYWDADGSVVNVENKNGINDNIRTSLRVITAKADGSITNNGFWGIAVRPSTTYRGTMYATAVKGGNDVVVTLESTDGSKVYAKTIVNGLSSSWQKFSFSLTTAKDIKETADTRLRISFPSAGEYRLARTTLFPPTYNNRSNGMRPDLMKMMAEMHPKFLRFPGGNYVEGNKFAERFNWKTTVGDPDYRQGHQSPWGYWSTDGMGLIEFMEWAEDVGAEPLLAVFAGYTLNGDYVRGDALKPFIQDALDEIEYVIGGADTKWGKQRIADGHPQPFPLHYVEIGNEDFFDMSGSYSERYKAFYDAIKAKYPQLNLILTESAEAVKNDALNPSEIKVDIQDDHYYRDADEMYRQAFQYDKYSRKGPKIFVGEWATREGKPTTNMNAALGDAAWMTCLERNSDLIIASCYAPLFVNVSPGGMQWESDLIGYNALNAYGSPSYYAQCMFAQNLGNRIVPIENKDIPTFRLKPLKEQKEGDIAPQIYSSATYDAQTGHIYLKLVNVTANTNTVNIVMQGQTKMPSKAEKIELKAAKSDDTNAIDNPRNIVPVKSKAKVGKNFSMSLAPYSITILSI